MEIIYNNAVLSYNPHEERSEGDYRLEGLQQRGKNVDLDFEVVEDILRVHTKRHLKKVIGSCKNKTPTSETTPDKETLKAIFSSVRLAIYASERECLAMTRPPGHHAGRETIQGFCFLNNMAIAAQRLVDNGMRVCILDIDGHHCNGTQAIFNKNKNVMICSTFEEVRYGSTRRTITNIGSGEGLATKLNLPVPSFSGDDLLLESLDFFRPYIVKFNPDVIGVSLGVDGYHLDHLLNLRYTISGFQQFGFELKKLQYPIFGVLEGGYHHDVVKCAYAFANGVNGTPANIMGLSTSQKKQLLEFQINKKRLEGKLNEILSV